MSLPPVPAHSHPLRAWLATLAVWLAALIATPIALWVLGDEVFAFKASLGVLAHFGATLAALSLGWPPRRIAWTVLVVAFFTWAIELLGVQTGLPFGAYHYTPALQPQLGGVPLLIPLAWVMMLPPAWAVAESLLSGLPWRGMQRGSLGYWLAFSILSGLAFTAWDLYLDPQMVARELWAWQTPGAYFGIPWQNYLGWWLTSGLLTLLLRPAPLPRLPLLAIYTITWLFQALGLGFFWGQPGPALAGFTGMGVFALAAGWTVRHEWKPFFGQLLPSFPARSPTR